MDFKQYVLGMWFIVYLRELTAYLNELEREAGDADFDYANRTMSGRAVDKRL